MCPKIFLTVAAAGLVWVHALRFLHTDQGQAGAGRPALAAAAVEEDGSRSHRRRRELRHRQPCRPGQGPHAGRWHARGGKWRWGGGSGSTRLSLVLAHLSSYWYRQHPAMLCFPAPAPHCSQVCLTSSAVCSTCLQLAKRAFWACTREPGPHAPEPRRWPQQSWLPTTTSSSTYGATSG